MNEQMSRRTVLSLGAALGLTATVAAPSGAWAWSPAGSVAGSGTGVDPQWVWDDRIDTLMAQAITAGQTPQINAAFAPWVNNSDTFGPQMPAEMGVWVREVSRLPEWADLATLRAAATFNQRMSLYLLFIYGIGGGIMSTVIPREAKSVYWSKGGADMKDRAAKTFTFGYDLADLNACEPGGQFLTTATKTRMVHAAVRHLLPQSPHWKAVAEERIPISVADILVTFHSTGTFAHQTLKKWGVRMSAAESNAFLHHWQVALHMLGVPDEYIPATWAAAEAQSAQVLTPILAPTLEGKALAETLLGLTAEVDLGVTRGFLNEFVRYQLGDRVGDWLGLKRDYVSATTIKLGWPGYIAFREASYGPLPVGYRIFDQFLRDLAMVFLNNGTDTKTTPITVPDMNRP